MRKKLLKRYLGDHQRVFELPLHGGKELLGGHSKMSRSTAELVQRILTISCYQNPMLFGQVKSINWLTFVR